jgi:cold shock CspA family protein
MKKGTVVSAFERRSFSFIQVDSSGQEIFGHVSDYPNRTILPAGTRVEFAIGEHAGKPKAINIRPLECKESASE